MAPPVLGVRDLTIRFGTHAGTPPVVDRASLELAPGEIHGLVGESGSGKTMIARAVLGLLPPGAQIAGGSIAFRGRELTAMPAAEMRRLRGGEIGMIFQEPMMSLNPALTIGVQMAEAMRLHTPATRAAIRAQSIAMLERVQMPDPAGCLARYPHEFSGGMRQRIMLASVLMLRPKLLLADEPTTALDVLIQKEVLEIMLEIVRDLGTAVLLITHDLGLVARYCQAVTVLRRGVVVERGPVAERLARPQHPYTRELLAALPRRPETPGTTAGDVRTPPLVEVRDLEVTFAKKAMLPWRRAHVVRAVDGVSFTIRPRETLAVVGESGSGKTTLGRAILRLVEKSGGRLLVDGRDTDGLGNAALRELRREMQIVFQDPYSSLDPRQRIGRIVGEGLRLVPGLSATERKARVARILAEVGIEPDWSRRFPHELSGGQRQRIGIARAIVSRPRLVVADEAVSALDLTVQAQVLELLKRLQARFEFSYLFITHDLGVVEQIADRVIVMYRGRIVEMAPADGLFDRPHHPYTCELLNAVPELAGNAEHGYRLAQREHLVPPPPAGMRVDQRYAGRGDAPVSLIEVTPGHVAAYSPG
ncbi:MAG TPA: ABC transporter ATP-binding protein [Woeseiaceae bacterium]